LLSFVIDEDLPRSLGKKLEEEGYNIYIEKQEKQQITVCHSRGVLIGNP